MSMGIVMAGAMSCVVVVMSVVRHAVFSPVRSAWFFYQAGCQLPDVKT
jgi:hypothetical protein